MRHIKIKYKNESEQVGRKSKNRINQHLDPQKAIENYLNGIIKKAV